MVTASKEILLSGSRAAARDLARAWRFISMNRRLVAGAAILLSLATGATLAPFVAPADPIAVNFEKVFSPPSKQHPLGTDGLGRDLLSRVIYGGRVSLPVGILSSLLALSIGVPVGVIGGYIGGATDGILMRMTDAMLIMPSLILAATIAMLLGPSFYNVILAIGLVRWPVFSRLVRGQVLSLREREYILAAKAVGAPTLRILIRHILPNIWTIIITEASLSGGFGMFTEASLNFLGVGVPPPAPTWGGTLREGYAYLEIAPWASIAPGLALFLGILAFNFIGDGLRDIADPAIRVRRS